MVLVSGQIWAAFEEFQSVSMQFPNDDLKPLSSNDSWFRAQCFSCCCFFLFVLSNSRFSATSRGFFRNCFILFSLIGGVQFNFSSMNETWNNLDDACMSYRVTKCRIFNSRRLGNNFFSSSSLNVSMSPTFSRQLTNKGFVSEARMNSTH